MTKKKKMSLSSLFVQMMIKLYIRIHDPKKKLYIRTIFFLN